MVRPRSRKNKKKLYITQNGYKKAIPRYYRKRLDITEKDYADIIKKNNLETEKIILDNLHKPSLIYKQGLTPKQVQSHVDNGQHIDGKPLTEEAYNTWLAVRKQYNQNLRMKQETNSRDKL